MSLSSSSSSFDNVNSYLSLSMNLSLLSMGFLPCCCCLACMAWLKKILKFDWDIVYNIIWFECECYCYSQVSQSVSQWKWQKKIFLFCFARISLSCEWMNEELMDFFFFWSKIFKMCDSSRFIHCCHHIYMMMMVAKNMFHTHIYLDNNEKKGTSLL